MRIENLAHVLRAARAITGEAVFVLVGSQAVLAQFPDAPDDLVHSMEIDLYPRDNPDMSEVIEGALGQSSAFHGAFGYHADGIGPETASLPPGWEERAVTLKGHPLLEGAVGVAPEIHDLCASKLAAFRPKDTAWVEAAIRCRLADPDRILGLVETMGAPGHVTSWISARASGDRCEP
ncbi:MAG: hypothetical protein DI629_20235 [Mesorhizobium amorphae]|nr:MAG: hypothetical protein DI629_20235 [Mesorhizobium amorphae]